MVWLNLGLMLLVAVTVVAWPLVRHHRGLSFHSLAAIAFVLALSAGLYAYIGTPEGKSAGSEMASIEEMVAGLDQRLQDNPDDLAGWILCSYCHSSAGALRRSADPQTAQGLGADQLPRY